MVSAQVYGKLFENEIHEILHKTKHDVLLNEKEIRQKDATITAIDHLLIANNICLCFQDKWISTTVSNSNFNHFAKSVEKIAANINMKVYAVYVSNTDLSSIANKLFEEENNKFKSGQSNIEYIKINNTIKPKLFNQLYNFLYSHYIFMYDKDDDCIML